MASQDSDGEEDFVTYGKVLEQYEEGEKAKKPIPLQDQTVKDEKGRFKRFHGAFMGGFSAGYYNTVGSKEGWAPSTFVSSRSTRSERQVSRPEDFMDDEDLGEFGIAPNEILTTDDFASKTKDRIREKARELASVTAPIPGATMLEDLIAPAKISIGVQLLRQMGWKEGQGVGPRTKRKPRNQKPGDLKVYGCALPPTGSEGSEDDDDDDEFLPENITFAPKDVTPIDFTIKDNVHGLGYRGLDPRQALFGTMHGSLNLFGDGSDKINSLLGDVRHSKGRKVGISGQAFGVGALEDEDDDIYGTETMSKYDTVIEEERGDGLFGWTAPKQYKNRKGAGRELQYVGKILEGFCAAATRAQQKKIYLPPELPRDYSPVHYFRPVLTPNSHSSLTLQAMLDSSQKPSQKLAEDQPHSRHQLNSRQRRDLLGETPLQGPTTVLDMLTDKDRERIKEVKQAVEQQRLKAQTLAHEALKSSFQPPSSVETHGKLQEHLLRRELVPGHSEEFKPFDKNPEKQKRYENYIRSLHQGQKGALESSLDANMTEWERGREQDEFMRSAMLYKPSSTTLSSRFTRAKHEDDLDKVEVARDEEGDLNDKASAVKMKMFGKLTRDKFEWHPDKLLCKRFNIPDPYPGSTIIGLPKVKRDKFSVFNFLTVPETSNPHVDTTRNKPSEAAGEIRPKKSSRWDQSTSEKKDSISEFISQTRSEIVIKKTELNPAEESETKSENSAPPAKAATDHTDPLQEQDEVEERPSIDIFKAIFADSSDEKSSSSEDESEDESPVVPKDASITEPMVPSSTAQDSVPALHVPEKPVIPVVEEIQEKRTLDEEFGPRLPPTSASCNSGKSDAAPSTSMDQPIKKQKVKKNKEKHKVKKDHKHKKEKKRKHKKQKHKKRRNKEASSSDTGDSSTSHSDSEQAVELTPKELLKRLKNLPILR
ncbi:G patch domain-containing 1 [Pelobates cultripes]|uniref:G patch domain-containing 1 n=1 Tax=Pelobates cultripes TaxID=61616 RepID=A0AAD1TGS0_PELCU|nr:G patch domain-containing 1 [Pelobates cultripes]